MQEHPNEKIVGRGLQQNARRGRIRLYKSCESLHKSPRNRANDVVAIDRRNMAEAVEGKINIILEVTEER